MCNLWTAFLAEGDYNVFLVDWEPLAASTFYLGPMANTGKVGKDAARFIDFLAQKGQLKSQDVHFIGEWIRVIYNNSFIQCARSILGHSLGAHVAGNAGHETTSGRLGRVTGLDPALPGIHIFSSLETRLDPSDAMFVDVIHSCGGVLGYFQPLGHADYYPNGGTAVQPGCCCILELLGKGFTIRRYGNSLLRWLQFSFFLQRVAATEDLTSILLRA